jgi:trans-aconitate methyltransferase
MVARALRSGFIIGVAAHVPVPLAVARPFLLQDNRQENLAGSWDRLRSPSEAGRYRAVQVMTERYGRDGFVLDVGCSQGLLQERLHYRRYVGVDSYRPAIERAAARADHRTTFLHGDADTFTPDEPPDVIVLNEVLYYLRRPLETVERYARLLAPDGVLIISVFVHSWATRRLMRRIAAILPVADRSVVTGPSRLAWAVSAHSAPRR